MIGIIARPSAERQAVTGPDRAPGNGLAAVIFWAVLALYAASFLWLRFFPSMDGPVLLYYGKAFRALLSGEPAYHSYFQLGQTAGAHVFYFYWLAAMSRVVDPIIAEKLFVALYAVWSGIAFLYLARSIEPRLGYAVALLALPFAMNFSLYCGFYDFCIGSATAVFLCGWWLRNFDRLTWRKALIAAALLLAVIVMHVIPAAIALMFAGIHVAACVALEAGAASGTWPRRVRDAVQANLKAAMYVASGLAILYLFKPASTAGAVRSDPFLEEPANRMIQLMGLRPFGPFESRVYRGALAFALLIAGALLLMALWRRRRDVPWRTVCTLLVTALVCLAAFVVVPFWIAGGAYFPQRFAPFAALFLIAVGVVGVAALGARARLALTATAAAVAIFALAFQFRVNLGIQKEFQAVLRLPAMPNARLGAVIMEDEFAPPEFLYGPQLWVGAHYLRRSGVPMLNSPWLDVPGNWLRISQPQPCQFMHPVAERRCLDQQPASLPLDVLVGVRGVAHGIRPRETERIARRFGLTERIFATPLISIYARPGVQSGYLRQ